MNPTDEDLPLDLTQILPELKPKEKEEQPLKEHANNILTLDPPKETKPQ